MPILTVEIVGEVSASAPQPLAQALADVAGAVLGSPPGRTWVKLRTLPAAHYAENDAPVAADEWPVFVTLLHREPPTGPALEREVRALTDGLARVLQRAPDRVHLEYLPAAAGRQSFGGRLIA
jgi:phenylpyruvate tautomerase PptA (4-oxalocrotonate tautomerase family)